MTSNIEPLWLYRCTLSNIFTLCQIKNQQQGKKQRRIYKGHSRKSIVQRLCASPESTIIHLILFCLANFQVSLKPRLHLLI